MKAFAIFLIILCLLALGGSVYLLTASNLGASSVRCDVFWLDHDIELRNHLLSQLESGTFTGIRFQPEDDLLSSSEKYQVCLWTVRVDNHTMLPARAVEFQVVPFNQFDILQFDLDSVLSDTPVEHIIPAGTSAEIRIGMIVLARDQQTALGRTDNRNATITWYLDGFPFPGSNGKNGKLVLTP